MARADTFAATPEPVATACDVLRRSQRYPFVRADALYLGGEKGVVQSRPAEPAVPQRFADREDGKNNAACKKAKKYEVFDQRQSAFIGLESLEQPRSPFFYTGSL